jgi:hypothetical protein
VGLSSSILREPSSFSWLVVVERGRHMQDRRATSSRRIQPSG